MYFFVVPKANPVLISSLLFPHCFEATLESLSCFPVSSSMVLSLGESSLTVLKHDLQLSCLCLFLCLTLLNLGPVWTRVQIFNTERVRVH